MAWFLNKVLECLPVRRTKLETLVTIQVHQRDVFSDIAKAVKERTLQVITMFLLPSAML